jgi:hypothetical protein
MLIEEKGEREVLKYTYIRGIFVNVLQNTRVIMVHNNYIFYKELKTGFWVETWTHLKRKKR